MTRASIALLTLALLGETARADLLILKRGGRLQVWGVPPTVGKGNNEGEVTPENADLYQDQSTGVIESEGYDAITGKKTPTSKAETFPRSEVVRVIYTVEPDAVKPGCLDFAAASKACRLFGERRT